MGDFAESIEGRLARIEADSKLNKERMERLEFEISQLHSDYNIERGFNRLFRVVMIAVMIVSIGISAWVGFIANDYYISSGRETRSIIQQELRSHEHRIAQGDENQCRSQISMPRSQE
jgi:hypothetical protein